MGVDPIKAPGSGTSQKFGQKGPQLLGPSRKFARRIKNLKIFYRISGQTVIHDRYAPKAELARVSP